MDHIAVLFLCISMILTSVNIFSILARLKKLEDEIERKK